MLILNSNDLDVLMSYDEMVNCMEEALILQEKGGYILPPRMHVDEGEDTLLLMPAKAGEKMATKLVSVFPGNSKLDLPPIMGTVIYNNGNTGEPLALINGSKLTALRTAAVSGVAMRHLSEKNTNSVGIFGTGTQGTWHALFACSQLNLTTLNVFDPDENRIAQLTEVIQREFPGTNVNAASCPGDLVRNSDLIITTTTSNTPVIKNDKELFESKIFIGVGSYKPSMREFPDALFSKLEQVFVDTPMALKESGDILTPLNNGLVDEKDIYSIGKLLTGEVKLADNKSRFFKSVGVALFDLFAADLFYNKAKESGIGQEVDL
ncbi:MAG: ornithine cyclodeaminase family protein [Bacteroidales bacterium]|nr:ornithine cyclodeaminase family protein [Bacteroidales bacterium]